VVTFAPHPAWRALGTLPEARSTAHRGLLAEAFTAEQIDAIRLDLQQQRAWGRDDFRAMVEARARRFAGTRPGLPPTQRRAQK